MTKQSDLEALAQDIKDKKIAPKLAAQANLVMGDGNLDADIVFIGEAPGKKEDLEGLPFVGVSGKLLNEMLASVTMKRENVYITNIVKYRPPNNRDPSTAEKEAFLPYLIEQLKIIDPKVIVTLGRHSMGYFLPDATITAIHGQPREIKLDGLNVTLMPLYHPAAAIYNQKLRQTLFEDFAKVPGLLETPSTLQ